MASCSIRYYSVIYFLSLNSLSRPSHTNQVACPDVSSFLSRSLSRLFLIIAPQGPVRFTGVKPWRLCSATDLHVVVAPGAIRVRIRSCLATLSSINTVE
jgi:hypothetical protein